MSIAESTDLISKSNACQQLTTNSSVTYQDDQSSEYTKCLLQLKTLGYQSMSLIANQNYNFALRFRLHDHLCIHISTMEARSNIFREI